MARNKGIVDSVAAVEECFQGLAAEAVTEGDWFIKVTELAVTFPSTKMGESITRRSCLSRAEEINAM